MKTILNRHNSKFLLNYILFFACSLSYGNGDQIQLRLFAGKNILAISISLPNEASVRLHEKMGFRNAGILRNVGRKFNTWIDVGFWQLELKNSAEYNPEYE